MDGRKVVVGVSGCRRSRSGDVTRYLIRALERSGSFDGVPDDLLTFFFCSIRVVYTVYALLNPTTGLAPCRVSGTSSTTGEITKACHSERLRSMWGCCSGSFLMM